MVKTLIRTAQTLTLTALFLGATTQTRAVGTYLSPDSLATLEDGSALYIGCATGNQVLRLDTATKKIVANLPTGAAVGGITLSRDGTRLYATCGGPDGFVMVLDSKTGQTLAKISAGHTPMSPVLSPDEATLYVCNHFTDDISVIDLKANKETARIPVKRQPSAATLTHDGKKLLVANMLPTGPSDGDFVSSIISVIDTSTAKVCKELTMINGSGSLSDIKISPDGKYAAITHILARFNLPTSQVDRGWMNANALTIVDIGSLEITNTVLLDNAESGAANPFGLAWTKDGSKLVVAQAGSQDISIIDFPALIKRFAERAQAGKSVTVDGYGTEMDPKEAASHDLTYLVGIRQRLPITAEDNGPHHVATIGNTAWISAYYSDTLCTVDTSTERPQVASIPIGPKVQPDTIRQGEIYFNDARICFQTWQSCNSCHPGGARVDAYNWDLLNDGIGNPKNTKSMLLAHQTPPAMSLGIRENAEKAVRSGIRVVLFTRQPESVAQSIDEYLKALKPVPSPKLVNGKLSEKAVRGEKLFSKCGCIECHPPGLYTDLQTYEIGTAGKYDKPTDKFDTPTLVELWRTGPYLHDGSALTVKEVVTDHNPKDKHGKTSNLTPQEIDDLCEYLLSL